MNDIDLEDLESRLYSQVYHGIEESAEVNNSGSSLSKPTDGMRTPAGRYFGPWSPASKFQNKSFKQNNNRRKSDSNYSKSCGKSPRSDISIRELVVLTQNPPKGYGGKQKSRRARCRALKKKRQSDKVENVIILSDSENDDSCVIIENNWPLLSVESEDEKFSKLIENEEQKVVKTEESLDDVILIEPVKAEIIDVDDDDKSERIETASVASSMAGHVEDQASLNKMEAVRQRQELNTPDSASNDFIQNSGVELNKSNFNFSLHGSDFKSGTFIKPIGRNETCETESSSSTTDINSINLMKSAVFNEIDFPKDDIFAEGNLETFGNFITPLRTSITETQSSPVKVAKVAEVPNEEKASSDSSSESEFEDSLLHKNKSLPDLSPMLTPMKKKKKTILDSKYDLISTTENVETEPKEKAKKKKKKKKKACETNEKPDETPEEDKQNRKKRRSSQMENAEMSESTKKKNTSLVLKEIEEEKIQEVVENQPINTEQPSEDKETKVDSNKETAPLEGLTVLDEFVARISVSSDNESVLSALQGQQDIQLNFNAPIEETAAPSTSGTSDEFSVSALQQKMSSDPMLWEILDTDRYPSPKRRRRCNKCKQEGHISIQCTLRLEAKCTLCGKSGHYESRCPNKLCTQCGQKSMYFTTYCRNCFRYRNQSCRICQMPGHLERRCPDLWRRYHLTTNDGDLTVYNGPPLNKELWCSSCAKPGHLEHCCNVSQSVYPPADPFVKSYEDVYKKKSVFERLGPEAPEFYDQNYGYQIYNNLMTMYPPSQQFYPIEVDPNQFISDDNLPNFIPFDEVPARSKKKTKEDKRYNRSKSFFFSSTTSQLEGFINEELQRLSKLSLVSNKLIQDIRKRRVPMQNNRERDDYYEQLNMLLFGVLRKVDGNRHLERLKQFKKKKLKSVTPGLRRRLHTSHNYIFGHDKHDLDYNELLRGI